MFVLEIVLGVIVVIAGSSAAYLLTPWLLRATGAYLRGAARNEEKTREGL